MIADESPDANVEPTTGSETAPVHVLTGRLVDFQHLIAALRRARYLWLGLALVGLLIGAGYHLVVPLRYSATTTLYLAHETAASSTAQEQNDLAMLDTFTVGQRAIALLGREGASLTPEGLLGKTPGTIGGSNIIIITISGPTQRAAVRRVNAVAQAYLGFRAHVYEAQNRAFVDASTTQVKALQAHIDTLNAQISALGGQGAPQQLASLDAQRATATAQLVGLRQAIQGSNVGMLSVVHGSRVITPGTIVPASRLKVIAFDGMTGLVAGLGIGAVAVIIYSILSDAIRRREDLAALVGAPVAVSVGRIGNRFTRLRSVLTTTGRWRRPAAIVTHYLREEMRPTKPGSAHLLVAADDVKGPAVAVRGIANRLRSSGRRVVLVDETHTRVIGRALRHRRPGLHPVRVGDETPITLLLPPMPWEEEPDGDWEAVLDDIANADEVLVVATIDPGIGAWHLRHWSPEAILMVTGGVATTRRLSAITELLGAAGISISSAVLFNADPVDESVGLPTTDLATAAERFEVVRPAGAPAT